MNGENSNVWFDRKAIDINAQESRRSMASIYETVKELIQREINLGVPAERIIVGGTSSLSKFYKKILLKVTRI